MEVTIERAALALCLKESKDVVISIQPIVFNGPGSALNLSERLMMHVILEFRIEDEQRIFLSHQTRVPTAVLYSVVLENANCDSLASLVCQNLPSRAPPPPPVRLLPPPPNPIPPPHAPPLPFPLPFS